ncbi:hypothetical protein E4Z66_05490 [Aliishimia ponticola]|uniref:Glyoxalase-related protein domain-containing protein n=1 Tax=Aliishimia ponticola TaxID=2499833 RepID=A0A4S4NS03_9RHOB|nr:glyoxalase superfamily protein [Aliishimia ponticola]THH39010.1 hypothetical protein E4Z66_05490 [Aliishimia ponticola]
MSTPLPTRPALKAQAKRLRTDLAAQGTQISHSEALEMIAHQWGAKDWNTLAAQASTPNVAEWAPGQRVSGAYLGHAFTGQVKSATERAGGYWDVTIRFDDPVDVVTSRHFSSFRHQVQSTLRPDGRSPQKISDGTPHMVLQAG